MPLRQTPSGHRAALAGSCPAARVGRQASRWWSASPGARLAGARRCPAAGGTGAESAAGPRPCRSSACAPDRMRMRRERWTWRSAWAWRPSRAVSSDHPADVHPGVGIEEAARRERYRVLFAEARARNAGRGGNRAPPGRSGGNGAVAPLARRRSARGGGDGGVDSSSQCAMRTTYPTENRTIRLACGGHSSASRERRSIWRLRGAWTSADRGSIKCRSGTTPQRVAARGAAGDGDVTFREQPPRWRGMPSWPLRTIVRCRRWSSVSICSRRSTRVDTGD